MLDLAFVLQPKHTEEARQAHGKEFAKKAIWAAAHPDHPTCSVSRRNQRSFSLHGGADSGMGSSFNSTLQNSAVVT